MTRTSLATAFLASAGILAAACACPLGDCGKDHSGATRVGDRPGSPSHHDPNEIINLPSAREAPYLVQHGPTRRADLITFPAKYDATTEPFAAVFIAYPPTNDAERRNNPRGWNTRLGDFPNRGWDVLDPYIQDLADAGFKEVWFWFWSGSHVQSSDPNHLSARVMSWFTPETQTPAMRASWPAFVRKWNDRGVEFGFWLGGVFAPNFGTAAEPDHRFLTREDFGFVGDTLKQIKDLGFHVVGLDAASSLLNSRDMPPNVDLPPHREAGPRDRGITVDLLTYLNNRSDLQGLRIATERLLPPGPMVAEAPTIVACSSRGAQTGGRFTIDTLPPLDIYNAVNPGSEVVALMVGSGWSRREYLDFRARAEQLGYRVGVTQSILQGAGVVRTGAQVRRVQR